jgi:hypothetical protein
MARGCAQGPCGGLVVSVEETFAKVVGRHASDEYPALLAEHTEGCIEHARAAFAAAGEREAAHTQRTLSEKVGDERRDRAPLGRKAVGVHRVRMLLAAVVAFGALCLSAGYSLAAPVKPLWIAKAETVAPLQETAAVVVGAPAGWIVFARSWYRPRFYGARVGWVTASRSIERRDKIVGWRIVVACVFASAACVANLPAWSPRCGPADQGAARCGTPDRQFPRRKIGPPRGTRSA